jgi:hypothetical protein
MFTVNGNVNCTQAPIKYAFIIFTDQSDTSRKFSTFTDAHGNYGIDIITSIQNIKTEEPKSFELQQNYPNPFSSSTSIPYDLNKQTEVSVRIYDILGREVKSFNAGIQTLGRHELSWNGTDNFSKKVASGVYFYQVKSGNDYKVKKMIFGSTSRDLQIRMPIQLNKFSKLNELKAKVYSRTFFVQIQNCDSTFPKIYSTQFSNVIISNDTTINFNVNDLGLSLCYARVDTLSFSPIYLNWELYINNSTGTSQIDMTKHMLKDNGGAAWSPDGKYIAYINWNTHLYLYDVLKDSLKGIVVSDTEIAASALWSPDGKKIVCAYQSNSMPVGTYIMDSDGSNKRKLKNDVTYFYLDGFHTIYLISYSGVDSVFLSNLDGTQNEFVVNLYDYVCTNSGGVKVWDFNPDSNELLLSFDDPGTSLPNIIAKYNITQRRLDTIAVSDSSWKYYRPKYSSDYKKIAFVGVHASIEDSIPTNRIFLLENDIKSTLLEFSDPLAFLDFRPLSFSTDDKYLAFTKNVRVSPGSYWWNSNLYVIEVNSKQVVYIDQGVSPIWNPSLPH